MDEKTNPNEGERSIVTGNVTDSNQPAQEIVEGGSVPTPKLPPVTLAILVICGVVWAGLNFGSASIKKEIGDFLVPSAVRIWGGAYWGLITSAFVHIDPLHGLFNMWWVKDFGRLLEPRFGTRRFIGFVVCASIVGSGWQLAFGDQTGIGFSGVVYAFFGYMLAARDRDPAYRLFLKGNTVVWMVGWLFLCIGLTQMGIWNIANAAHVSGLVFGYVVGSIVKSGRLVIPARVTAAVVGVGALVPAAYMPWSEAWKYRDVLQKYDQAEERAKRGDPEGQYYYSQMLFERGKSEGEGSQTSSRARGKTQASLSAMEKEGLDFLKRSAEQGYVLAMNDLAWKLATDPRESVRNGNEALKWAQKACEADQWKSAAIIDTLAASHAELRQWDKAIAFQEMAIERLAVGEKQLLPEFQERLDRFRVSAALGE